MNIKNFLDIVCKEIKYNPVKKPISEELETHLQEIKEDYINNEKITNQEAEEKAVKQMGTPEEIGKKLNKIHKPKLDWKLLSLLCILSVYGLLISFCKIEPGDNSLIGKTIFEMIIGLVLGSIIYFYDYRKIKKYSNLIYIIAICIIIVTLFFGIPINGKKSHLYIGGIITSINACTIAVPLFIIAFTGFLTNYNPDNTKKFNFEIFGVNITINKDLLKIIICSLFSLIVFTAIPSYIDAFLLAIVYITVSTIYIIKTSKNRKKILFIMYGSIISLSILLMFVTQTGTFRMQRLVLSFNPELDPQGSGYTGMLQKEILENSKLIGEADTNIITTDDYIISKESNFTFIYLVGKIGIIGASILVLVIIFTSIKLIINAKIIKNMYGKILIIGLSSLYILQSIWNILMNINLGIQQNINLPFVSSGGQFFVINCLCMALILSVYRRKDINLDENYECEFEKYNYTKKYR